MALDILVPQENYHQFYLRLRILRDWDWVAVATLCLGMDKGKKVDGHKHIGQDCQVWALSVAASLAVIPQSDINTWFLLCHFS